MVLQKQQTESDLHFFIKKKIGEALSELGFEVEYEKTVKEGRIDVYAVKDGNEIKVEVQKTNIQGWVLAKITGDLYKKPVSNMTTIAITFGNKKKLDARGNKGDTYDDILNELFRDLSNCR